MATRDIWGSLWVRALALQLADCLAWPVALGGAALTHASLAGVEIDYVGVAGVATLSGLATLAAMQVDRLHPSSSLRGSFADVRKTIALWIVGSLVALLSNSFLFGTPLKVHVAIAALPVALMIMLSIRLVWRTWYDLQRRPQLDSGGRERVIVFGAGEGGEQIIRAMLRDPETFYVPVAILDDDPSRSRRSIQGVRVEGTRSDMIEVATRHAATELLIAIPSASAGLITNLSALATEAGLEVRVLPSTSELLGMLQVRDIRHLTEADLLGRAEVNVDLDAISAYITGRNVLVTGAGGSIGSELCRQLHQLAPKTLLMLDRDETALHGLQLSMEGRALLDTPNLIVADIRDRDRLDEIFAATDIDVVFHTAALKHLALLEHHPPEGVKTNVLGTLNLLDAAQNSRVSRFVNVSTDKAADPTSVLGATKLIAERLTARTAETTGLPYVSVRFGNVLGSRGSVLPTFRDQIERGGPITITHPEVTRYFMTIPEAVRLVLQAGAIGRPGETMILDMGEPVKIVDVAKKLIHHSGKNIKMVVTGLRDGEKLHEILVGANEIGTTREHPRITHTSGSVSLEVETEFELVEPGHSIVTRCADELRTSSQSRLG